MKITLEDAHMPNLIHGIHHITAIASDARKCVAFYSQVLGLRLVKKTVNQDDVATYHLFFGDRIGNPGMDLTFFIFQPAFPGVRGAGQVTLISLAVPEQSLSFWQARLKTYGVKQEPIHTAFGKQRLIFYDGDDQRLELVGVEKDELLEDESQIWSTAEIPKTSAIRAFHSARLSMQSARLVDPIFSDVLGYERQQQEGNVTLYQIPDGNRATHLEIEADAGIPLGETGAGTVHHIAFAVADQTAELAVREQLLAIGLYPTEVIDRFYFRSVYFRTPFGVLCEIATEGPGFTAGEDAAHLGEKLDLPPFLESRRQEIEANLVTL